MKSLSNLLAMSAIFLFIFNICGVSEEPPKQEKLLGEKECWEVYYDFIAKTKPYGIPIDKQEHEKKIKPKIKFFRIVSNSNCIEYCAELGDEKNTFMLIDRSTGEVLT